MKNWVLLRHRWFFTIVCAALLIAWSSGVQAQVQATLSKSFEPDTVGPGAVSTITFTITNATGSPVTGLAFTDVLPTVPGDVDIADPANASTDCPNGILTAPDGGGTISFSDGDLGDGTSCTVTVDVTASTMPLRCAGYDGQTDRGRACGARGGAVEGRS
ncbi:MAG: hypothetical protein QNL88_14630 [Acidobacteriota bacterium]|nr:hypothetical protein [Acidobacteriota bacterium]